MEKQLTCEERVDTELESTLAVLRDLWGMDNWEDYHPEHETNMYEYGLDFGYIEAGTFAEQEHGYFRYQLSWGGPSDEFRFFVDVDHRPYKIEYWFMDWFDGAHRTLRGEDRQFMEGVFEWFAELFDWDSIEETS